MCNILLFPVLTAFLINPVEKKIDAYLMDQKDKGLFNGTVFIAQKDNVILSKGYGYSNYEHKIPNSSHTIVRIASITKCFTALAIMQMHEKKLLNVDDSLVKYLPDFPNGEKITLHHLLTHTAGIANYNQYASKEFYESTTLDQLIEFIISWPLDFEPGSQYNYSNSGYILLTYIIEKVSGMNYEQYLQENIFIPCNMYDSGVDRNGLELKNRAQGYFQENNTLKTIPLMNVFITQGSGILYSSITDLYKWDRALFSEQIVSKQTLNMMLSPHILMPNSDRAHGYGWFIDKKGNKKVIEYSGSLIGFQSKYIHFIEDDISIIVLSNVESIPFDGHKVFFEIFEFITQTVLNDMDNT